MRNITRLMHPSGGGCTFACCLLIVALAWPATSITAQAIEQVTSQAINWKSEADASTVLMANIQLLNQQMPSYTAGTTLYDNALRRVAYFKEMIQQISQGTTVEDALELALPAAATLGFSKEATYTSKVVLHALHEEARVMLSN